MSRFLRAVGDPTSKLGTSVASAAAAAVAAGCTAPGLAEIDGPLAEDMAIPTALDVTSKGLMRGSRVAADGTPGGADHGTVGVRGTVVGGSSGEGGDEKGYGPEPAEKRAIEHIFRKVDLDDSGHVSQEELLEAVSMACERVGTGLTCRIIMTVNIYCLT